MSLFDKLKKKREVVSNQLTKQRDNRCIPIAKEIIKKLAEYETPMGSFLTPEKTKQDYTPLAEDILKLLLEKDVLVGDVSFIFQLALQPYQFLKELVTDSVNDSITKAAEKFWGKEETKVTMKELDKVLKS